MPSIKRIKPRRKSKVIKKPRPCQHLGRIPVTVEEYFFKKVYHWYCPTCEYKWQEVKSK